MGDVIDEEPVGFADTRLADRGRGSRPRSLRVRPGRAAGEREVDGRRTPGRRHSAPSWCRWTASISTTPSSTVGVVGGQGRARDVRRDGLRAARRAAASMPIVRCRRHRSIESPTARSIGAITVGPDDRIVIVEGNYLLLERPPWGALRGPVRPDRLHRCRPPHEGRPTRRPSRSSRPITSTRPASSSAGRTKRMQDRRRVSITRRRGDRRVASLTMTTR